MGPYIIHSFSECLRSQDVDAGSVQDVAAILAPGARIADFTGYYLSGPDNPDYEEDPAGPGDQGQAFVSWDSRKVRFLPSTASDWRPWPWPPSVDPFFLGIHGSLTTAAFVRDDTGEQVAPWAVGGWARGIEDLKAEIRPVVDPIVLMCCHALPLCESMANETGRVVWASTGDFRLGAEVVSLADSSAGVMAKATLSRTADGRPGQFRSAYPHGPAGDRVRWAYRERFGSLDVSWMAEQFAPAGAVAPPMVRPRQIKGPSGFFGWSFYDERDWNSRQGALSPARLGSAYATWVPNDGYQPGMPRDLDPRTGKIIDQAEPWHRDLQGRLPFDAGDAIFVTGYFVDGHFLVSGEGDGTSYLESPADFGARLKREYAAAAAAGLVRGQARRRTLVLLTDNEPVPQWAARLVASGLGNHDVITVSRPGTMFLDDHPGAGIPATRVALLPGRASSGAPVWTLTSPEGVSAILTAPSAAGRRRWSFVQQTTSSDGAWPAIAAGPGLIPAQDLALIWQSLEAGVGIGPEVLVPGSTPASVPVLAVRGPIGIDFADAASPGRSPAAAAYMTADGEFQVLEISGNYDPSAPTRINPVIGQYPLTERPVLSGSLRKLPFDPAANPLYVFVDYHSGYFLLRVRSAASQTVMMRAENASQFGRRIRAEIMRVQHQGAQAPASRRPVVLLARHRPVSPQIALAVARELGDSADSLYTASMPAFAYIPAGSTTTTAALALIRLPGQADEPEWTQSTPPGVTARIDTPPLRQEIKRHAIGAGGNLNSGNQPTRRLIYNAWPAAEKLSAGKLAQQVLYQDADDGISLLTYHEHQPVPATGRLPGSPEVPVAAPSLSSSAVSGAAVPKPEVKAKPAAAGLALSAAELRAALGKAGQGAGGGGVGRRLAGCVGVVRRLLDLLYSGGVRPARSADDTAAGLGGVAGARNSLVAGPGWAAVVSWDALETAVMAAGTGAGAVVLVSAAGGDRIGHAVLLYHTSDGPRWADPDGDKVSVQRPAAVLTAAGGWAVMLHNDGKVAWPTGWTALESARSLSGGAGALADLVLRHDFGAMRAFASGSAPAPAVGSSEPADSQQDSGHTSGVPDVARDAASRTPDEPGQDPYLWLEDARGRPALDWVRDRNAETTRALTATTRFEDLQAEIRQALDSKDEIPLGEVYGGHIYEFSQHEEHPQGCWRRAALEQYLKNEPDWEILLDLDALAAREGVNWVWGGAQVLPSGGYRRALVRLSHLGADKAEVREFDLHERRLVEDGFKIPAAGTRTAWIDADHIYVATDFGPGSLTSAGYPRVVKEWRRGTPLTEATVVFEGALQDVAIVPFHDTTEGFERSVIYRSKVWGLYEVYLRPAGAAATKGGFVKVPAPEDASVSFSREWLTIHLRSPWTVGGGVTYLPGSLLAARLDEFMGGDRKMTLLFEPDPHTSLAFHDWTRTSLILTLSRDVRTEMEVLTPTEGQWQRNPLPGVPQNGYAYIMTFDSQVSDDYFLVTTGFTQPKTIYHGRIGSEPEILAQGRELFDTTGLHVRQFFAVSDDGTLVPYFVIGPEGSHGPVLLTGYGGLRTSLKPAYDPAIGRGWLARGGTYVVANIRGGEEYGPQWHQSAVKENRRKSFEDFASIAKDLVQRGIATPEQLGAFGSSNGGLLMGVMLTRYPEHFGAIAAQVPLLDMLRYHLFPSGRIWIAEFGNPDVPTEREYLRAYSPYHNVEHFSARQYPAAMIMTSENDDRVSPGHARKMTELLREHGQEISFYESAEGGHGGAVNTEQDAFRWALLLEFMWQKLTRT